MPNGQLLCINQTSHALMAAEFCRYWGNQDFAPPTPYAEVMLAVSQHDNGWYEWELKPKLRPDGYPMDFLHDPDVLGKLNLWRRGINRSYEQHPYAALLIGHYAALLYAETPPELFSDEEHAHIAEFTADQEMLLALVRDRMQENGWIRSRLHHDAIKANTNLLRFCDRASLHLAMPWASQATVTGCPVDGDGRCTKIEFSFDDSQMSFSPWPFSVPSFDVHMHGRLLGQRKFSSAEDYHAALSEATFYSQKWRVHKSTSG